jgi:maleate isomerase
MPPANLPVNPKFGHAKQAGWRARIGFLIPPGTPTVEREMYELAPAGVSVHFGRMVARGPVGTLHSLLQRAASHVEHLDETVEMLASVKPDVIVLAHTATSYYLGKDREEELVKRMQDKTGLPFITTFGSVLAACRALDVTRVAVGTAYDEALSRKSREVLESHGLQVVNMQWLPDVRSIFEETEERVYGLGRSVDHPDAQIVFISGVGLPTLSVLGALEADLGKPAISSAASMMWQALKAAGITAPVMGYGRLLEI